ncbi:MAG TPA: prolipoprotein diacylglyceryl transferase family protein, partial [Aggregatilineales bacterium]|nr:prolipoprotein diacylglyceryl transferase family protein [Aggregatilineales bacterium]
MNGLAGNSGMVTILGFPVHAYPILVAAGILCGGLVAALLARGTGQEPAHVWRALVPVCLWSIAGGRLWFVLFPPLSYLNNSITAPWMLSHFFDLNVGAVALWAGGLGLFGALPFGTFALVRYASHHRLPVALWLDIAAVALPLAQAIARIGNGINLDLYGAPTTLQWGMLVSDP